MKQLNNMQKLEQVAQLIPGAPKSVYSDKQDIDTLEVKVLKGSDVDQEGIIKADKMELAQMEGKSRSERYMLREGDVVLMVRGTAMRAAMVSEEIASEKIIANANFIIIRPDQTKIKGEVVFAYLQSELGKQQFRVLSTGAVIQHIPVSSLRNLQIPVPSIENQEKIRKLLLVAQKTYRAAEVMIEQQRRTVDAAIIGMMV